MNTIDWHMNATQGGANCAHAHGLRLNIFKCFSAKNTTRHDLANIFTKNVKNVTQYANVVTNVNLVTVKKVLPD